MLKVGADYTIGSTYQQPDANVITMPQTATRHDGVELSEAAKAALSGKVENPIDVPLDAEQHLRSKPEVQEAWRHYHLGDQYVHTGYTAHGITELQQATGMFDQFPSQQAGHLQAGAYLRLADAYSAKGDRPHEIAALLQAGTRLSSFYRAHPRDAEVQAESLRTMGVVRDHLSTPRLPLDSNEHVLTAAGVGAQHLQADPETHEVSPGRDDEGRIFDPEADKRYQRAQADRKEEQDQIEADKLALYIYSGGPINPASYLPDPPPGAPRDVQIMSRFGKMVAGGVFDPLMLLGAGARFGRIAEESSSARQTESRAAEANNNVAIQPGSSVHVPLPAPPLPISDLEQEAIDGLPRDLSAGFGHASKHAPKTPEQILAVSSNPPKPGQAVTSRGLKPRRKRREKRRWELNRTGRPR